MVMMAVLVILVGRGDMDSFRLVMLDRAASTVVAVKMNYTTI